MNTNKDQIYRSAEATVHTKPGSFVFDKRVASVFADMISRSVPGYQQILEMLPTLTRRFSTQNSNYYDLGCSLGAGMLAMAEGLGQTSAHLIGVDNSRAMIEQAERNLLILEPKSASYSLLEQDLLDTKIESAAMVLMNFTLQFVPLIKRDSLIEKIYVGLLDGGSLVLSEKIRFDDDKTNNALIDIHHQYKSDQGYSQMEISQKRDAIVNVLIPETLETHVKRLKNAGFNVVTPWVQNLQFISILAIK
ncbi:MAG: tRNA (cmo5U34)-methyltransferase [Arenicella sp.]|jgi:tRNA (cmo5U34)-methyltransferase